MDKGKKDNMDKFDKLDENTGANNSENKLLSSLGLCARARALIIGTPMVIESLRKNGVGKPKLVLEASDTSENTHKRIADKCAYYNVRLVRTEFSAAELSDAIGKKSSVAAVAICDVNFCKLMEKHIKA